MNLCGFIKVSLGSGRCERERDAYLHVYDQMTYNVGRETISFNLKRIHSQCSVQRVNFHAAYQNVNMIAHPDTVAQTFNEQGPVVQN